MKYGIIGGEREVYRISTEPVNHELRAGMVSHEPGKREIRAAVIVCASSLYGAIAFGLNLARLVNRLLR